MEAPEPAPPPERDPVEAARGASIRLEDVIRFRWANKEAYLSGNTAAVLRMAAAQSGGEPVEPRHLASALISQALSDTKAPFMQAMQAAEREAPFFTRLVAPPSPEPEPPGTPNEETLLHWSTVEILAAASALRKRTNPKYLEIGQRHLLVALMTTREGQGGLRDIGAFASGFQRLRDAVLRILEPQNFARWGDAAEIWTQVLDEVRRLPQLVERIERRPDYLSDRVRPSSTAGQEPLGAAEDAQALADLILLEAAQPPLALGLFGPWGSGKSTLIEYLKEEIRAQTARARGGGADTGDERTRIVTEVVQLSFNAWTFADSANLWATFTSEIFDQLAVGGVGAAEASDDDLQRRAAAASLVSEVAARTAREVASVRIAEVSVKEQELAIEAARQTRDEAVANRRSAFTSALAQAVSGLNGRAPQEDGSASPGELAATLFRVGWLPALGALAAAALLVLLATRVGGWRFSPEWTGATAVGAIVLSFSTRFGTLIGAWRDWRDRRRQAQKALAEAEADLRRRSEARDKAERERQRSQAFLSHYGMDAAGAATTSPLRMLDYLLKESEAVASVRAQTGMLATVRRCFEQLETVVAQSRDPERAGGAARIDRIILYIDDLDRCGTKQVSDILQAVHLLLSFDCFVVVVAADANWLKQSLEEEHRQLFVSGSSRLTAADYLEKIFQIPFWVRPLVDGDAVGPERFDLYRKYVDHLLGEPKQATREDGKGPDRPPAASDSAPDGSTAAWTRHDPQKGAEADAPRRERMKLTEYEQGLIKAMGPLCAKSPRAVKRLINVYRLIRVRLEGPRVGVFLGLGDAETPSCRAVLFALACEVGLPPDVMAAVANGLAALTAEQLEALRGMKAGSRLPASGALRGLIAALRDSGRLDDFLSVLGAVKPALTPEQLRAALDDVRRYSFRPL